VKIISACIDIRSDLRRRSGAPSATRTRDLLLRRQLLYPLSYRGQPGQGGNLLAGPKPNRSAAIARRPSRGRPHVARAEPGREYGRNTLGELEGELDAIERVRAGAGPVVGEVGDHPHEHVPEPADVLGEHPEHLGLGYALALLDPGIGVGD
jgi:hypothetical protein